jgi:dehydrogenase/reductase SDR family member 12
MITLQETTDIARARHEVFAYVADFSRTPEWDATATVARRLTAGADRRGLGLCGTVRSAGGFYPHSLHRHPPGARPAHRAARRLPLVRQCRHDHAGRHGHRNAAVLHGNLSVARPAAASRATLQAGMARMGRASVDGLRSALEDAPPPPRASPSTQRADRWVVPGVLRFSRLGIRCSRKHWQPMSAWLGGKQVVITGASSGLGLAAAIGLARLGAQLTLVIRNPAKAEGSAISSVPRPAAPMWRSNSPTSR